METDLPTTVDELSMHLLHDGDYACRINHGPWGKRWMPLSQSWWSGIELLPRDGEPGSVPFDKDRAIPKGLPEKAVVQAELEAMKPARRMLPRTFAQIDRAIIDALLAKGDER